MMPWFDPVWALLALPVVFSLGWLASRLDLRQLRAENRSAPKAYFKGLNYLLNEQQDQAIDAFIEAVQKDPDTSELHFALGNLFRRRGEYERAVRVHQHLLARADLSAADRQRARYALAMDFLKAGLLDHAETALRALDAGGAYAVQAQLALLGIYERGRDWPQADAAAARLQEGASSGDFGARRAHFHCEMAQQAHKTGDEATARSLLAQAIGLAPQSARARMALSEMDAAAGHHAQAFAQLQDLLHELPACAPLAARRYAELAQQSGHSQVALQRLHLLQAQAPCIDIVQAIVALEAALYPAEEAAQRAAAHYLQHLQHLPSLLAAARWLALQNTAAEQSQLLAVQAALRHATTPLLRYRCAACGFEASQHHWQCPGCQSWDSYPARRVEEL